MLLQRFFKVIPAIHDRAFSVYQKTGHLLVTTKTIDHSRIGAHKDVPVFGGIHAVGLDHIVRVLPCLDQVEQNQRRDQEY